MTLSWPQTAEQKRCLKGGTPVDVLFLSLQHTCFPARISCRGPVLNPSLCFLDPFPSCSLGTWIHIGKAEQGPAETPERCLVRGAWSLGSQCLILISPEIFLLCSAMATAPMLTSKLWPGTTVRCRNSFPLKSRNPIYCLTQWRDQGVLLCLVDGLGP